VKLAVIVSFLNEERHLPVLLASIEGQTRQPDQLLLVDDGSTDCSYALAAEFAERHDYARALRRPPRPPQADRLASAAELRSFHWAARELADDCGVVAKFDADLDLHPQHFDTVMRELERDARLGVAGAYLSLRGADGTPERETHPPYHVRGANKFYPRAAFELIHPVPPILGWDTIDELTARMHGWRTQSFALPGGDSIHLRPTGAHDGSLRAFRRWGECAWGYGAHPLDVALGSAYRMRYPPLGLSGAHYFWGWASAAARRLPRAEPEVRAYGRREQLRRIRRMIEGRSVRPWR
jgi:glycosyltransferase involved in cell wall biosynthesis